MNNTLKIIATDGKQFNGTVANYDTLIQEVDAYEANLKLLEAKAEADRKAKEDEEKKLKEYRETKLAKINDVLNTAKVLVNEYEKKTGNKLVYTYDIDTKKLKAVETRNTLDFAWDNCIDRMFNAIRVR